MNANEWGLSAHENERLRSVLRDDERLVLLARPRGRMPGVDAFFVVMPGLILAGFLGFFAYQFGEGAGVFLLFFSPVVLLALGLLSSPLRYRWRMVRTLYVLTDKRAIVFEQQGLWKKRCICWPLFPGLVKKATVDGNLIFDYEFRHAFSKKKSGPQPVGFLHVPQPEQVRHMVEAQVAAVPADKAPFAYRPANLRAPAPRLDAWGSPLAQQPGDMRELGHNLVVFSAGWTFFALLFVVMGLWNMRTESRLEAEGVETTATVLRVRKHTNSSGGRRSGGSSVDYFPTLRYTDAWGVQHTVDYSFSTDNFPRGHRLAVVYHPAEPETLRIVEEGLSPGARFTLAGSFFALFGGGLLFLGIRLKRKAGNG